MRTVTDRIRTDRGCRLLIRCGEFISRAGKSTLLTYLLNYSLTYLLQGAESFLRN